MDGVTSYQRDVHEIEPQVHDPITELALTFHLPYLAAEDAAFPNTWDSHECYSVVDDLIVFQA